jgi:hypothetical protein
MGAIADTLRATLRDLAESDARLYRGLAQELAGTAPSHAAPSIPAPASEITDAIRLLEANGYAVTKL